VVHDLDVRLTRRLVWGGSMRRQTGSRHVRSPTQAADDHRATLTGAGLKERAVEVAGSLPLWRETRRA
jgi:hypothetical protein